MMLTMMRENPACLHMSDHVCEWAFDRSLKFVQSFTFNLQFGHATRLIPAGLLPMPHDGHQRESELETVYHGQSDRKALQSRRGNLNNLEELL